ncbi:hypothetical protein Tco_0747770 [Tanacetum coccineum]|uniref:Mitochondrial protein n=1 Tax=Tanacetum coccineum TaxID=301880 RepID=A0ABQ4YTN5_9ASTR
MLKKYGLENSKITKTPISRKRVLTLDKHSESIDSTRGMIASLLYLTASRLDIMFSVCLYARFQEDPKVSHLEAVKRIFRKMSNSEESVNKGEIGESSKKLKRKFETMKGYIRDERVMFEFILRDFAESEIWDKVKESLNPRLNEDKYFICCENTTHMINALKEARMASRDMLLSIHHSLKMLLDIISKMNRKLEDEKIKMNNKGKRESK